MKQYFPFTDYDFYAYITAGMLLIAAIDYSCCGAVLVHRTEWTVVQLTFWVAIAYLLGQIVAGPSSALLEHGVVRGLLYSPLSVALGFKAPRWREQAMRRMFANREYAPLPAQTRAHILKRAAEALSVAQLDDLEAEAVFGIAFSVARTNTDTASRLDQFRNLYGFSRNVSFVSIIAFILLSVRYNHLPTELNKGVLLAGSVILAVGMFGRFLKFYAAFSREVVGSYASNNVDKDKGTKII